jgi:hypothetical protein
MEGSFIGQVIIGLRVDCVKQLRFDDRAHPSLDDSESTRCLCVVLSKADAKSAMTGCAEFKRQPVPDMPGKQSGRS